jgi:hypothetical protein
MRIVLLLVGAALALALFVGVVVVWPRMERAETRGAAQALITGASPAERHIAAAAEKAGSLAGAGRGVKLSPTSDPKHGEFKWVVADNGAIRGWNEKNAIEIAITPVLEGGKVSWRCHGFPNDAMPASCGGR